jgi:hypothetical protein
MTVMLAITIPQGIEAVAWGMTAMAAIEFLLNTAAALRYLSTSMLAVVRAIAPSLLLAVAMFLALHYASLLFASWHVAMRLVATILFGGVSYLSLALLFRLRALSEGVALLRELLKR